MADYRRDEPYVPSPEEKQAAEYRPLGFEPIWTERYSSSYRRDAILAWKCRRGCGTVVWDVADHIKNVCKEWSPIVG